MTSKYMGPRIFSGPSDLGELIERGYIPIGSPALLEFGFNVRAVGLFNLLINELEISNKQKLPGICAIAYWCRDAQRNGKEDKNQTYTIVLGLKRVN